MLCSDVVTFFKIIVWQPGDFVQLIVFFGGGPNRDAK